ncbi:MAG: hypothetical protein MHMPM18_004211, partial [Marteilia pararefringens]
SIIGPKKSEDLMISDLYRKESVVQSKIEVPDNNLPPNNEELKKRDAFSISFDNDAILFSKD